MKAKKIFLCTIDEEDGELVTLRMAPVDLCALLALADEMDDACPESASVAIGYIDDYALRIREAVGA